MKRIKWIFIGLLLMFLVIPINAEKQYSYDENGTGTFAVENDDIRYIYNGDAYYYITFTIITPPSEGCLYMLIDYYNDYNSKWENYYNHYNNLLTYINKIMEWLIMIFPF